MSATGFEHTNPGSEQPQTHALDRGATGTGRNGKKEQCVWRLEFRDSLLATVVGNSDKNGNAAGKVGQIVV